MPSSLLLNATAAPYNCDPTGATDSLAGLQRALDDASAAGGGDVALIGGGGAGFALSGPLQMRTGVRLLGLGNATIIEFGGYAGPLVTVGLPGASGQFDATYRPLCDSVYDFTQAGVHRYALKNKGLAALIVTGHPLQFGYMTASKQPDYWAGVGKLCIDLYVERPAGVTWPDGAKICGTWDRNGQPQPWSVEAVGDGFWLNLKGNEAAYRVTPGWHRLHAAADMTATRFRLIFQVDTATGTAEAWCNATHVTMTPVSGMPASGQESITGLSLLQSDGVRPFMVGYGNDLMDAQSTSFTNLIVYGLMVCRGQKYQWGVSSPTLATSPGIPVTDNERYFNPASGVVPANSYVASLPLTDPGGTDPWVDLSCIYGRGLLFWCPPVNDANTPRDVTIEGLELQGLVQPALLMCQHLTLRINRMTATTATQAFGSMPVRNAYVAYISDCDVEGTDAALVSYSQIGEIRGLNVVGAGRQALRFSLGEWLIDGVKVLGTQPWTETIITVVGGGDGAGYDVRNVFCDNEASGITRAAVLIDSGQGGNGVGRYTVAGLKVSEANTFIELDGAGLSLNAAARVDFSAMVSTSPVTTALRVVGPLHFFGNVDATTLKGAAKVVDVIGADARIVYAGPDAIFP